MFTVAALFYGDYPELARRCLDSIQRAFPDSPRLILGGNTVCDETAQLLRASTTDENLFLSAENVCKYPLMRRMLYERRRVDTPYLMWFDDDSHVTDLSGAWPSQVAAALEQGQRDMLGEIWSIRWQGRQEQWVQRQPWYSGQPLPSPYFQFITGGWWCVRAALFYKHNYPWPELRHRGGDTMWGACCHQQGLRLRHFNRGVRVNTHRRRGTDHKPLGFDG